MRAYVDIKKFFCGERPYMIISLLHEARPLCNLHLKMYCALITVLIFAQNLSTCCQMSGGNAS